MALIAGLDFGTSGVKLAVLAPDGSPVAGAQAGYPTRGGRSGTAEQHAEDWWEAARSVLARSGLGDRIDAIGLTGQMQDLVPVSADGALRPVLLYSDTRAVEEHARLRAELPEWERDTENQQDASNVAAKIAWLAEHEPETLGRAEHLLLGAPGYIAWRASGSAVCDVLTASTTGLLGVRDRGWLRRVVEAAGASVAQLPRLIGIAAGDEHVGSVSPRAAAELGVRAGIPVVHAMGDAGSTTDGLVGSEPGDAYLHLGSTGWLAAVTSATPPGAPASPIHRLVMPGCATRLRIGSVQSAGATAEWARRTFLPGDDLAAAERRAAARLADPASFGTRPLCLPGLSGERAPVRDPALRGAFIGVDEATEPIDFYLATLTGVAMGLRHVADEVGLAQARIPLVGGGGTSGVWQRILADVFDATILTGATADPGTRSAVRTAAAALGIGDPPSPLFSTGAGYAETAPSPERHRYAAQLDAHRELYRSLAPTMHRLSGESRSGLADRPTMKGTP